MELMIKIMEMEVENVPGNKSLSIRKKEVSAVKKQKIPSNQCVLITQKNGIFFIFKIFVSFFSTHRGHVSVVFPCMPLSEEHTEAKGPP